jgi:hypothetical protein
LELLLSAAIEDMLALEMEIIKSRFHQLYQEFFPRLQPTYTLCPITIVSPHQ